MKNYVYVYHVDGPVEMTEERTAAWSAWFESLGSKLVDGGNPFNRAAEARITAGAVDREPDTAAGYSVVTAGSLEEAIALALTCPMAQAPGCAVKVYETMPM